MMLEGVLILALKEGGDVLLQAGNEDDALYSLNRGALILEGR